MSELKRTPLYDAHRQAGATLIDFGGWEMPVQYPTGIIAEHMFTRSHCSLFDVSHMGRMLISGAEAVPFLQYVLSSNVSALKLNCAQYCILSNNDGYAIDDAYLYRYEEDRYMLVVNAGNQEKDFLHLEKEAEKFDCQLDNISKSWGSIAVQGPESGSILADLSCKPSVAELAKNALDTLDFEGHAMRIAKTGYTGEPIGYEVFCKTEDIEWFWNRLIEMGAKPAGLGARDTLRMEAGLPLYGHELGLDPDGNNIPIFAIPPARFAVNLSEEKGNFIGRTALEKQASASAAIKTGDFSKVADLPRHIRPITLLGRGVLRNGMPVYMNDKQVGWVTSGTMVPYSAENDTGKVLKRSIGLCYIDSDILYNEKVEVDLRGQRVKAVIVPRHLISKTPPFALPVIYDETEPSC